MRNRYFGFVDGIENGLISGWVVGPDRSMPSKVYLSIDNKFVLEKEASIYREGVKLSGHHDTGVCGFSIKLPPEYRERSKIQVHVYAADRKTQLTNSPVIVNYPLAMADESLKICFMHIAKTAGSSVNTVVSSFFEADRCATHIEVMDWKPRDFLSSYDFISGHIRIKEFLQHQDLSEYKLVTVLRKPIEQLASHLCWLKRIGENKLGGFFNSHPEPIKQACLRLQQVDFSSVEDVRNYVNTMSGVECILFDNCQVRYFIADYNTPRVTESSLVEAKEMASRFDYIGFNDNLPAFYRGIGLAVEEGLDVRDNVQNNRYGLDVSRPELYELLSPLIKYDNELYEYAKNKGN